MFKISLRLSIASRLVVLCAVILVHSFFHFDVSSPIIVLLGFSIMAFTKIHRSYFNLVWPLLAVLIIGFMGVISHESNHILRDISFALTPISLIFMGYWMAENRGMWPLILKVMVFFGFVLAAIHLSAFVLNPALLTSESMEVRKEISGTGVLVVFAFVLGLFQKYYGIPGLFPRLLPNWIVMPVLLASFVLSFSRSGLVVAIIFLLSLLGWISRINRHFVLAILVIVVGYIAVLVMTSGVEELNFSSKIARIFSEVAISNYQDIFDIHRNWRGFETYKVIESFLSGNPHQYALGQGFGAIVDLGFYIPLGGDGEVMFRYIPIFHNGYGYILIKAGLLGLVCYLYFYTYVIGYALRYSHSMNKELRFLALLLLGCVLSLIALMYVIGGMAQMQGSELVLLLGFLMRRIRVFQPENNRLVSGSSR